MYAAALFADIDSLQVLLHVQDSFALHELVRVPPHDGLDIARNFEFDSIFALEPVLHMVYMVVARGSDVGRRGCCQGGLHTRRGADDHLRLKTQTGHDTNSGMALAGRREFAIVGGEEAGGAEGIAYLNAASNGRFPSVSRHKCPRLGR